MYPSSYIGINYQQHWERGNFANSGSDIKVIDFGQLSLLYELEDYIKAVSNPLQIENDAEKILATSSLKEVFYLALITVIRKHGIDYKDRFFENGRYIPLTNLVNRTISNKKQKVHLLDSLYYLFIFAYKRCYQCCKFELDLLQTNKHCFYYFISIFEKIYQRIICGRASNFKDQLHVKAILKGILKKDVLSTTLKQIKH